jgi:hypothetical protein
MKEFKTWEILKPGNYPEGHVTPEIVNDLVSTFGKRGDVPIGIGHEQYWWRDDLPAEGYIRKNQEFGISKNGSLVSKGIELFSGLKEAYEEGRYSKWSAVIGRRPIMKDDGQRSGKYSKWELFAVDVLGRTPPAISGLKDLTGKNTDELKKKYGIEISEEHENTMIFSGQEVEIMQFSGDFVTYDNNKENEDMTNEELQKQIEGLTARFSSLESEKTELSSKIASLEAEKTEKEKELASYKAKAEEAEKAYKSGQIEVLDKATSNIPKEMKERLFSAIEKTAGNNISFSEGENKVSLHSVIAEVLNQVANVNANNPTSGMDNSFSQSSLDEEKKAIAEGAEILNSSYAMINAID